MEEESTIDQLLAVVTGLAGSAADILKATNTPATIPPSQNSPTTQARSKGSFLDSLKANPALLLGGIAAVVAVIFFATRR